MYYDVCFVVGGGVHYLRGMVRWSGTGIVPDGTMRMIWSGHSSSGEQGRVLPGHHATTGVVFVTPSDTQRRKIPMVHAV